MSSTTTNQYEVTQLLDIAEDLFAYVGLTILLLGTIGNMINVISFARLESLKTLASSLFLLTSCIASQVVLVTGLLTRVIRGFSLIDPVYTSVVLCKVRWMIRTAAGAVSLTCVCLAAIDRYLSSCHNVHRHGLITIKRARWSIFISICFWSSIFSSYAVFYTAPTPLSCTIANPIFAYFTSYFNLFHYSILPLSVLSIFCMLTWHNLGQQPATYIRGGIRLYDQITRMLIAQSIDILITSFPNMIWQIYTVTSQSTTKSSLRMAQENLINTICVLIGFSTHAITFYVYLLASSTFRKNVKDMLLRNRRIKPLSNANVIKVTITKTDQKVTLPIP
ncbi:unnamed protein product [Rotaria sordida]|uniref:G-protein coupled receptors family 1 profile domain-containing protein n=1 Tax=Rotaria sordida TaxID=392033 RepID=A0A818NYN6_9BILA|nr:unnamed protein product [Rotaria sordida]CAF1017074.1 unnamed protein product [Rotaria sordida]CAF1139552.1 unnamed protein product [Rotaria sordida]CAF3613799.1 unnamed protein product [Rotaria sordida]